MGEFIGIIGNLYNTATSLHPKVRANYLNTGTEI